jgi:hypothetical protein
MNTEINEIEVNGVKYYRNNLNKQAEKVEGMEYCVIRSYGAGVFCGYVKEQKSDVNGVNVTLVNSRRIWYWDGACSLSQLAVEGSKNIDNCNIAMVVPTQFVANVIEIIPMTKEAKKIIEGAKIWKK